MLYLWKVGLHSQKLLGKMKKKNRVVEMPQESAKNNRGK